MTSGIPAFAPSHGTRDHKVFALHTLAALAQRRYQIICKVTRNTPSTAINV